MTRTPVILNLLAVALATANLFAVTPAVTAVTARQRYPWNGKVDIAVSFSGASNEVAKATCMFAGTNSATGAALAIKSVTEAGTGPVAVGTGPETWMRHYVWDATADVGEVQIADVTLNVEATMPPVGGVQLWANGPYWAECNVGATKSEEYGYYFWWGDTVGYRREGGTWTEDYYYSGVTWVSSDGRRMSSSPFSASFCPTYNKRDSLLQSLGYIDSTGNLAAAHDAATAHLGAPWRMPTCAEMDALISNCTTILITTNGVYGCLVVGKGEYTSKSIFLPAAGLGNESCLNGPGSYGNYWSSTPHADTSKYAWGRYIVSRYFNRDYVDRYYGRSVRPLLDFADREVLHAASTHFALDTRTGTRCARAEEPISFSTEWRGGVTRLVLNVEGANVIATTAATNGVYVWQPDFTTARTVTLTHTTRTLSSNEVLTATFTVGISIIYVDAENGDDVNDGSTAALAVKTLGRAYALAESGDVIHVAAGTYAPVTAAGGKAITFRAADGATIDGGGAARCVTADADVVFENFTLANGYDAEAGGGARGGTFDSCTITNCMCDWDGGGAYGAILRNCVIVGNTAENGFGGGTYGGTLENCRVTDNASGDGGGGAYAPERILDTMFRGNSPDPVAGDGGTVTAGSAFVHAPAGSEIAYSVSYDWLVAQGMTTYGASTADLDANLSAAQTNGVTGWESYVAGLAPTNPASRFATTVAISNGMVYVGWRPNLNAAADTRIYALYGRTDLGSGDWERPIKAWHRFFKVEAAMPTDAEGEASDVADVGFVPKADPATLVGVQLWAGGPYWAECNVGATKPEEYGYYFWWGDTVGYRREGGLLERGYEEGTYSYLDVTWVSSAGTRMSSSPFSESFCPTYNKSDLQLQSLGYVDSTGNLVAAHDAATAHLGAPWRMPTYAEMDALISNCTTTWITTNGVCGRVFTGKGAYASKSIFLPAVGCGYGSDFNNIGWCGLYWSSTPDSDSEYAWYLYFNSSHFFLYYYDYRYAGFPIRPLRESAE